MKKKKIKNRRKTKKINNERDDGTYNDNNFFFSSSLRAHVTRDDRASVDDRGRTGVLTGRGQINRGDQPRL